MSWTRTSPFVRDDGETEIEVEFEIYSVGQAPSGMCGPPEHYDPGSGPELAISRAWIILKRPGETKWDDGPEVDLTEAERDRIEEELYGDPDLCDFLDGGPDE